MQREGMTMTKKETNTTQTTELRRKAEQEIVRGNVDQSPEDLLALSHERAVWGGEIFG